MIFKKVIDKEEDSQEDSGFSALPVEEELSGVDMSASLSADTMETEEHDTSSSQAQKNVVAKFANHMGGHNFVGDMLVVYAASESKAEIYLNMPDVNLLESYFKNGEGANKTFRLNITDDNGNIKYYYKEADYSHKHYRWGEATEVTAPDAGNMQNKEPEKEIKDPQKTSQQVAASAKDAPRLTHTFEMDKFGKKRLFIWQLDGDTVFNGPGAAYLYIDRMVAKNEAGFEDFKKIITVGNKDFNSFPEYGYPVFWFRKNAAVNIQDEEKGYAANKPNFLDTVYDSSKATGFELFGKFYDPAIRAKAREEQKLTDKTTITAPKVADNIQLQKSTQTQGGNDKFQESDTAFLERIAKTMKEYAGEYGGDALELALGFVPVVGDVYDLLSALLGRSPITGEKFDSIDRALTLVGVLPIPFASGKVLRVVKKGVSWLIPEKMYREALDNADKLLKDHQEQAMKWLKENWAKTEEYMEELMGKAKKGPGAVASKYADAVDDNFKKKAKERGKREVPTTDSDYLAKSTALGQAIIITEGSERLGTPVDILMVELRRLVPVYKGVKGFKYTPTTLAPSYKIIMLGSEFIVKEKYNRKKQLPSLDSTGKIHGDLPKREDFSRFSKDELRQLQVDLKKSVKARIQKNIEKGPQASDIQNRAHGQRQAQEQQLIKDIETYLNGK